MSNHIKLPAVLNKSSGVVTIESVADVLERELQILIEAWLERVEKEPDLAQISLSHAERTGHLPQPIHDVIYLSRQGAETKAPISEAAADHGDLRHRQGYSIAMMVGEFRLLHFLFF
jgi:hypothetical protein